jgi:hypothetical protein
MPSVGSIINMRNNGLEVMQVYSHTAYVSHYEITHDTNRSHTASTRHGSHSLSSHWQLICDECDVCRAQISALRLLRGRALCWMLAALRQLQ